jgi:hypothetical protein
METMGDAYAVLLHDDRLRAGLVAPNRRDRPRGSAAVSAARAAVASGLRALAAAVEVPRPVPAELSSAGAR